MKKFSIFTLPDSGYSPCGARKDIGGYARKSLGNRTSPGGSKMSSELPMERAGRICSKSPGIFKNMNL
jgi:hypothetical protein